MTIVKEKMLVASPLILGKKPDRNKRILVMQMKI